MVVLHFTSTSAGSQPRMGATRRATSGAAAIPRSQVSIETRVRRAKMSSRCRAPRGRQRDNFDLEVLGALSSGCASSGEDLIMSSSSGNNEPHAVEQLLNLRSHKPVSSTSKFSFASRSRASARAAGPSGGAAGEHQLVRLTRKDRSGSCRPSIYRMVPERDRIDSEWVTMRWLSNRTPRSNDPSVTPVAAKNTLSPETNSVVVSIRSVEAGVEDRAPPRHSGQSAGRASRSPGSGGKRPARPRACHRRQPADQLRLRAWRP